MKTVAFFNNKGGVGKTSLAYHLAWMFSELGLRVIAADLDPQANLSSMFLSDEQIEKIWQRQPRPTIYGILSPLIQGTGDLGAPAPEEVAAKLALLAGDLALSEAEDQFSANWPLCLDRQPRAFRITAAFARMIAAAGKDFEADVALVDVGPNLGAINRAALIAADAVVVPLGPDLFSLQGLRNMGPKLRAWRSEWKERVQKKPPLDFALPAGKMKPIGYIIGRHSIRLDRPVQAYARWIDQMPGAYLGSVLGKSSADAPPIETDPNCIAQLKDYRSLMPMAQEHNKPMFLLKPGDGAIGGHQAAVQACYADFRNVAVKIAARCDIELPNFIGANSAAR